MDLSHGTDANLIILQKMSIDIQNTLDEKLKKDYKVSIASSVIETEIDNHIERIRTKVSLKGFRKGQVPASVIKEKYGESIMAEEADKII